MVSQELRNSLLDLQITALEKIAQRNQIAATRHQLQEMIERGGISGAYDELTRRASLPQPPPKVSFFSRLARRWFGSE